MESLRFFNVLKLWVNKYYVVGAREGGGREEIYPFFFISRISIMMSP